MKRAHMPQSSSNQFMSNSDSDFVYPSVSQAADSAQITSQMMPGDDMDSLMLNSIDTSTQGESEDTYQSQICLPHLQNSQAQIAAFTVAPSQPADTQAQTSKEKANQPPEICESPERDTNVAPDEGTRRVAKTVAPNIRPDARREQRSQPQANPMPWHGTVKATNKVINRAANGTANAKRKTVPTAFQKPAFQDSSFQDPSLQDTVFQKAAFQKAKRTVERASNVIIPEPALQPTTYQIPIRSREVTLMNAIICSFPRLVMLFLLGIGIAYMAGLAFPSVFSWLVLSSLLSGLIRGLGLVVLVSLAIAFVLEFR